MLGQTQPANTADQVSPDERGAQAQKAQGLTSRLTAREQIHKRISIEWRRDEEKRFHLEALVTVMGAMPVDLSFDQQRALDVVAADVFRAANC